MILCLILNKNMYLLQDKKRVFIYNGIKGFDSRMYCIRLQGDA